jgi:hypothetical protein
LQWRCVSSRGESRVGRIECPGSPGLIRTRTGMEFDNSERLVPGPNASQAGACREPGWGRRGVAGQVTEDPEQLRSSVPPRSSRCGSGAERDSLLQQIPVDEEALKSHGLGRSLGYVPDGIRNRADTCSLVQSRDASEEMSGVYGNDVEVSQPQRSSVVSKDRNKLHRCAYFRRWRWICKCSPRALGCSFLWGANLVLDLDGRPLLAGRSSYDVRRGDEPGPADYELGTGRRRLGSRREGMADSGPVLAEKVAHKCSWAALSARQQLPTCPSPLRRA